MDPTIQVGTDPCEGYRIQMDRTTQVQDLNGSDDPGVTDPCERCMIQMDRTIQGLQTPMRGA